MRRELLTRFNMEIGAGLGPLAGKIWRVGLMGHSSSLEAILLLPRRARSGASPAGARRAAGRGNGGRHRGPAAGRVECPGEEGRQPRAGLRRGRVRVPGIRLPDASRRGRSCHRRTRPRRRSSNSAPPRRAARGPRRTASSSGCLRPNLPLAQARRARRRGRRVLAARGDRRQADQGVDRARHPEGRPSAAAAAPSRSSWRRTSTSRRRRTPSASCASC